MKTNFSMRLRLTKIIATIGPACDTDEKIRQLITAGCDVLRLNASHMHAIDIKKDLKRIAKVLKGMKRHVPIMVDLQGPRLRTGELFGGEPMLLRTGDKVDIKAGIKVNTKTVIAVPCPLLSQMISKGDSILLDNGSMELKVKNIRAKVMQCVVVGGGVLGRNKGINLPQAPMTLPALSTKDLEDVRAAVEGKADYLALSFVRSENDVLKLKKKLKGLKSNIPIIAKIEKPSAVDRIDAILQCADAIMVARGDLGIEAGIHRVPIIQKELIRKANEQGIPVITATQMLESMILSQNPTRAEASDVANAVFDGSDAVMLSGETAIGNSPSNCIRMMHVILKEAEKDGLLQKSFRINEEFSQGDEILGSIVHAGCSAAERVNAKAIVVYTQSGKTAEWVSKLRPKSRVFAMCFDEVTARRAALGFGLIPLIIKRGRNTDDLLMNGERVLKQVIQLNKNDRIVVVSGRLALRGLHYMMKVHQV